MLLEFLGRLGCNFYAAVKDSLKIISVYYTEKMAIFDGFN